MKFIKVHIKKFVYFISQLMNFYFVYKTFDDIKQMSNIWTLF